MSTITVTQEGGPLRVEVARAERVTPNMQRITFTGADFERLRWRGFDQWVRLFLPSTDPSGLDQVPQRMTPGSYLKLQTLPVSKRPTVRNYTLRDWRPETRELDIDFVIHGDTGVAGPWSLAAQPGDPAVILDQGCGWPGADGYLLITADETGIPATLGILRDLPRNARGVAMVELADLADAQDVEVPEGMDLHWLVRRPGQNPGDVVLAALTDLDLPEADRYAFTVGESRLVTGVRRHLVRQRGWGKDEVTFCGYWKC